MSTRELSKDVARVIRGILAERRVTVQDFAAQVGQPYSSVARWVNQGGSFKMDRLDDMADALGMDAAELVLLALRTRPKGDDGGLADAIEEVRPPKRASPLRSIPRRETGT
jgi:transcriptional regulator with XRE-family HTH domain